MLVVQVLIVLQDYIEEPSCAIVGDSNYSVASGAELDRLGHS